MTSTVGRSAEPESEPPPRTTIVVTTDVVV
jgi:hypothetical protein